MPDQSSLPPLDPQSLPYIARLFAIESGNNPNAVTGSNRGLGQFGPQEEARYGITDANRSDYGAQAAAVQREAAEHTAVLQRALGRPPSPGELYLTHQQGVAGGPALLTADPSMPAWQAIRPYYRSDAIAKQAITGNIPSNHPLHGQDAGAITAGDFRNLWVGKFEGGRPGNVAGFDGSIARASMQPGAGGGGSAVPAAPAPASPTPPEAPGLPPASATGEFPHDSPAMPAFPANALRLRNAIAGRMAAGKAGVPLPPSVAQRLASLMARPNYNI